MPTNSSIELRVSVLGPLTVQSSSDAVVVPTAPKQRQLLALLALRRGARVSVDTVKSELWPSVPTSGSAGVHTYVRSIRRALRPEDAAGALDLLESCYGAYRLNQQVGTDAAQFDDLVGRAAISRQYGRLEDAAELLQRALSLWQGRALMDLCCGPVLELEVLDLEKKRASTRKQRFEIELTLGRHHSLVPELLALCAREPLDERLFELGMVALYRSGQVERALALFRSLRISLKHELGVEPGPGAQRLHQSILCCAPELDVGEEGSLWTTADGTAPSSTLWLSSAVEQLASSSPAA